MPHWSLVRLLWRFASGRAAFLVVVAGPELVPTTLRRPDAERALFCPPLPPCDTQRCDMAPGERGNCGFFGGGGGDATQASSIAVCDVHHTLLIIRERQVATDMTNRPVRA